MCRYARSLDYFLCQIASNEQNHGALQMIARSQKMQNWLPWIDSQQINNECFQIVTENKS